MSGAAVQPTLKDELDRTVRVAVYRHVVDTGRAPPVSELGAELGYPVTEVRAALERLAGRRTLVLDPVSRELWMAPPFSAVPTPFRVTAAGEDGRGWWANCAWDALAIPAVLRLSARIETRCGDCGEPMALDVDPERGPAGEGVVHLAVPAARWWDDIGFT